MKHPSGFRCPFCHEMQYAEAEGSPSDQASADNRFIGLHHLAISGELLMDGLPADQHDNAMEGLLRASRMIERLLKYATEQRDAAIDVQRRSARGSDDEAFGSGRESAFDDILAAFDVAFRGVCDGEPGSQVRARQSGQDGRGIR